MINLNNRATVSPVDYNNKIKKLEATVSQLATAVQTLVQNKVPNLENELDLLETVVDNGFESAEIDCINRVNTGVSGLADTLEESIYTNALTVNGTASTKTLNATTKVHAPLIETTPAGKVKGYTVETTNLTATNGNVQHLEAGSVTASSGTGTFNKVVTNDIEITNDLEVENIEASESVSAPQVEATLIVADRVKSEKASVSRYTWTDADLWQSVEGNDLNNNLLRVTVPKYEGIINLLTKDGEFNISIVNNALISFNQEQAYLWAVDILDNSTVLYFNMSTEGLAYSWITYGEDREIEISSDYVPITSVRQTINTISGTVGKIVDGTMSVNIQIVETLPAEGTENTIYVVRNKGTFYWKDGAFVWGGPNVDLTSGHTTTGTINENLVYPVTQYTSDYSDVAFNGTFYDVEVMQSEQIPEGTRFIYVEDTTVKFTNSNPAPRSGLVFGSVSSVNLNKAWFESLNWIGETVELDDFSYSTPSIKISKQNGETGEVATQGVQSYVDYKQNAINYLLDVKVAENRTEIVSIENLLNETIDFNAIINS